MSGTKKKVFSVVALIILLLGIVTPIIPNVEAVTLEEFVEKGIKPPRVALVKLWEVDHAAYMAKFPDESTVVVFESHGDVRGGYISIIGNKKAYVYDTRSGYEILSVTADSDGDTFNWAGEKVWDRAGFFSADGSKMIEDVRWYGTNARVVKVGSWSTIPIDWGFTDTNGNNFYACQLDYSGMRLTVGYIAQGKLLVFKYDPWENKYVKIFEHQEYGNYGRRLHMTLDGKYIVVGGLDYGYMDIWRWDSINDTYVRIVHYQLPDSGGLGALGISDPYNIGYIIGGTKNGWVIIAQFYEDNILGTYEFKVIYQEKVVPDDSWIYNPFYDRWIPQVTEVFALCTHRDSSREGYAIVYDVFSNKTIVTKFAGAGTPQWSAAAVSPQANYAFIGNALYLIVKRDVQILKPRVRFWGNMQINREYQNLGEPLVFDPPTAKWHLYFYGGRLEVKRVHVEPIPVDLVMDPAVQQGRLTSMNNRGMIKAEELYTQYAEFDVIDIKDSDIIGDELKEVGIENPDNFIAMANIVHFNPPPYFWEGEAWSGTVISIPISRPIRPYDDITLQLSMSIHTSSVAYDKDKRALAVLGVPVEIGGGIGIGATAYSKIAYHILRWYATGHYITMGTVKTVATTQAVSKVVGIVGIAIAVWGGIDAALVEWGGFGDVNIQNWIVLAPTVEDPSGKKYTAIELILPLEESDKVEKYYDILSNYFINKLGYDDVGFRVSYPCKTWDEYKTLIAAGYTPTVKLDELIEETIAAKYNLSMDDLVIKGVDALVINAVRAKETFWEWFFGIGGVRFATVTLIGSGGINVKAKLRARTITDPKEIAEAIDLVTINGVEYHLTAGEDSAYVDFAFELGAMEMAFAFGEIPLTGYFADLEINTSVLVKQDFEMLGDFGFTTTLHYDWNNTLIRIKRIEFADMPYPMVKAERIFVYSYGNFTNDITDAFELSDVIDYEESPSGKLYYYMTIKNTKYIDPTNGGMMQPCKTYIFNYYYKIPPDAGIIVYLNGTKVTNTLAHHAIVVVNSTTVEQDVKYSLEFSVKYLEGSEEKVLMSDVITDSVHVPLNGSAQKIYDITKYTDAAIEFMRSQGRTAYLEVVGRITEAEYNHLKHNDTFRVVYYPPPLLPVPVPQGTYNVTVRVLEYVAENYSWIPSANANVRVYYGTTESNIEYTAVTNESGEINLTLDAGTWTFIAFKEGFVEAKLTAPIYDDTVIQLYLSPVPQPSSENRTYVSEFVTVTFNVYDAINGTPVPNATITLEFVEPNSSDYYGSTFGAATDDIGKAVIEVPIGIYNVSVNAIGYNLFQAQYHFDESTVVNIALTPEGINITDYANLEVRVVYSDSKPYKGAYVEFRNATDGSLISALITDSYGKAVMLLPINQDYNVTVIVNESLNNRSYEGSKTVTLTQDTVVTFTVPWNSPQPPIYIGDKPYYWLSVQVLWKNGLPFHGAVVELYNYTSGELIDTLVTNGTGTVHFLLPAFQMYMVTVNATNPYNTSQTFWRGYVVNLTDNFWIKVKVDWYPEEPQLAKNYRVLVYAYDVRNGSGISNVTVVLRKGDVAWANVTNSSGYAEIWIPFLGLYNVTGIHPDYAAIWRNVQIYENNTLINLPMSPVAIPPEVPPPPLNGSWYPPIYINGTPHYWLSVQVVYKDGYPFHGANVTVIDVLNETTIATGVTNGTGFVHFLIPANMTIRYTVDAYNPDLGESYYDERELNMTQHYYFVHTVPWTSEFFAPEVWLKKVEFLIHRGQGYFFGNVSHLALLTIWTNKPQTVTVQLGFYNVDEDTWVVNKTVSITLKEGINTIFEWIDVNASEGGNFKIFANITSWEYDTNTTNNWAWSEERFLKPQLDIRVFALWRPVDQKQSWSILPEDVIEIDIGIVVPIKLTTIPAKLNWKVEKFDLEKNEYTIERGGLEDIRVIEAGIIWRNITVAVPWSSKMMITVNVTHEWEDMAYNNFVNITIPIDPDVKIEIEKAPSLVFENVEFTVVVNVTSNVEAGEGIGWVSLIDNETATLLKRIEITLEPKKLLEVRVKAPENPTIFWIFRKPTSKHTITTQFAGYDVYTENNAESFTVTVMSYQWMTALAVIIGIIVVIAALKVLLGTVQDVREMSKRFVKRKRFLKETIWDEDAEKRRFVKKK